jgi:hypothetical protein
MLFPPLYSVVIVPAWQALLRAVLRRTSCQPDFSFFQY